jgi:flagellin
MSATVNTNYGAIVAQKNLAQTENTFNRTLERLSSGKKTINARDDAAGVAIAGKMEAQIRGLSVAIRHTRDGQSMTAAADGSLKEIHNVLQRMRELAVNASSGIASNVDKDYLNLEMSSLVSQVESSSLTSKFNQIQLLRGQQFSFFTDIDISGSNITTVAADMAVTTLGIPMTTVSIGGEVAQSSLDNVISAIDNALATVDDRRANLGAVSNRFDHIIANLQNIINNTERSKGIMIDADLAIESTKLASSKVLLNGGTSMLANANAQKKLVLTLFNQ